MKVYPRVTVSFQPWLSNRKSGTNPTPIGQPLHSLFHQMHTSAQLLRWQTILTVPGKNAYILTVRFWRALYTHYTVLSQSTMKYKLPAPRLEPFTLFPSWRIGFVEGIRRFSGRRKGNCALVVAGVLRRCVSRSQAKIACIDVFLVLLQPFRAVWKSKMCNIKRIHIRRENIRGGIGPARVKQNHIRSEKFTPRNLASCAHPQHCWRENMVSLLVEHCFRVTPGMYVSAQSNTSRSYQLTSCVFDLCRVTNTKFIWKAHSNLSSVLYYGHHGWNCCPVDSRCNRISCPQGWWNSDAPGGCVVLEFRYFSPCCRCSSLCPKNLLEIFIEVGRVAISTLTRWSGLALMRMNYSRLSSKNFEPARIAGVVNWVLVCVAKMSFKIQKVVFGKIFAMNEYFIRKSNWHFKLSDVKMQYDALHSTPVFFRRVLILSRPMII